MQIDTVLKINLPQLTFTYFQRLRLLDLLNQNTNKKVILLNAGGGWGKSTLLSAYAHKRRHPVFWYTMTSKDGDPSVFLTTLANGIKQVLPELSSVVDKAFDLGRGNMSGQYVLGHTLMDAIFKVHPQRLIIILDDYHTVGSKCGLGRLALVQLNR